MQLLRIGGPRMSSGESSGPIHPTSTKRKYQYQFTAKHHRRGGPDAARWLPTLSSEEEFGVFASADTHEIMDERGWLYGAGSRDGLGVLPDLRTWGQQLAEFPHARAGEPYHGYPLWPLVDGGPENRRGEDARPSKAVFSRMVEVDLISDRERRRLYKGDHL